MNSNNIPRSNIQMNLINIFRDLWSQYIIWIRTFIINDSCDFGNLPYITERIIQNTQNFEDAFFKYYGYVNSQKFEQLLKNHFFISTELMYDVKTRNTESVNSHRIEWYKNADEIADFLASINPYWSKEKWQNLLYDHIKMLEVHEKCLLLTQYEGNIENYQAIENQSKIMADYMAEGIIKQFKFYNS